MTMHFKISVAALQPYTLAGIRTHGDEGEICISRWRADPTFSWSGLSTSSATLQIWSRRSRSWPRIHSIRQVGLTG
jgi:hypothetical protein